MMFLNYEDEVFFNLPLKGRKPDKIPVLTGVRIDQVKEGHDSTSIKLYDYDSKSNVQLTVNDSTLADEINQAIIGLENNPTHTLMRLNGSLIII